MAIQLIVTTSSASDINVDVVPVASQTITIDRGLIGPAGPAGPTTLAVGTTTTGAAGTSAFVANSGTSTAAVFDFTIPQGVAGTPGATGATGAGVPVAGTVGQVLTKNSSTNYDTSWVTPEVTLTGSETLTNKTIAFAANTLTGVASTTTAQTLTNKTLTTPTISSIFNTGTLTLPTSTDTVVGRETTDTLSNKTLSSPVVSGSITEGVFAIVDGVSVDLNPANGTIQTWTLGASRTPTATSFASGQSMTLQVDDGAAYSITWTSLPVTWKTNNGTAPTLNTTGFTVIVLWKVGSTIFGARVGNA